LCFFFFFVFFFFFFFLFFFLWGGGGGGPPPEIYNIGGGTELTNLELTQKILNLMGKDESFIEHVADRLGHDMRYSVNMDKISHELGYRPLVNWEVGIAKTVEWYQGNEAWWRPLKN
jgi:dTDP-glucose 4,6-dehydratase